MSETRWSVGALAKAVGLTVRTLHHYDDLGLLKPSERTASGHRRYTEPDLHRLYQIRLLRQLGMSLEEIGGVLKDPEALRGVLRGRLQQIDDEVWRLTTMSRQISGLMEQLDGSRPPPSDELLTLLGRTSLFDQYLTKEQQISLGEQATKIDYEWLDTEWPAVLKQFVVHCQANTPVDDPQVRATVGRLGQIMRTFTGGDVGIMTQVGQFFQDHGLGVLRDIDPGAEVGTELWDYVSRAVQAQ
ncbi:MerR family transcriptional regulator [Actinocrispum sp. NPDC049592]|uniref:MerR family transcriptional regulator n=1 Tax=Actinocrispum sp. NPDC049592 TaxID=3154835 RepID=UPI0034185E8A